MGKLDKILYLECYSGISSTMVANALLELVGNKKIFEDISFSISEDVNGFVVAKPEQILEMIECLSVTRYAKELVKRIFMILVEAEAKEQGVSWERVELSQVLKTSSIRNMVAVAVCIDDLPITDVIVSPLYEGCGCVSCQGQMMPVPVAAVLDIVNQYHLALHIMQMEGQYITPVGAAIVAAIQTTEHLPEQFTIDKIGMGREFEVVARADAGKSVITSKKLRVLRAMIIQDGEAAVQIQDKSTNQGSIEDNDRNINEDKDCIYKLESNIDDCTGENLGFVVQELLAAGARDVYCTPIYMKKNRPAYQINIICKKQDIALMEQILFEQTTTIGIRRVRMERTILQRQVQTVQTSFGEVDVKICMLPSGQRIYPEYESLIVLCKKYNISYQEAYRAIVQEVKQLLKNVENA